MVSANKLKNDFVKYSRDELEKLSNKECDDYINSLVAELMKNFKNGAIVENPDANEINDLIDSYMEVANNKFSNADVVLLDRKFKYLLNAYFTANVNSINQVLKLKNVILMDLCKDLISAVSGLDKLLLIYHDNYSNYSMLNNLFFNLSNVDNLPLTFDIHQKYLEDNEFGVNTNLMCDLDYYIKSTIEKILFLIDKFESMVDIDEISADDYFDNIVGGVKDSLKHSLSNITDFDRTALINSGYDSALFYQIENAESEIDIVDIYISYKDRFMNLYNTNGFFNISSERFDILNKKNPTFFSDFDEFMKIEPKYDLKNFKLIEPDVKKIAY